MPAGSIARLRRRIATKFGGVAAVATSFCGGGAAGAGTAGPDSADIGGFLGVRASARGLGAFTQLAPAMPSSSS